MLSQEEDQLSVREVAWLQIFSQITFFLLQKLRCTSVERSECNLSLICVSGFVVYCRVIVWHLWLCARDDKRKQRERIFDAGWQEIYSRQRKSESGPGEIWKWLQRNIVWRAEEIQVWGEIRLALIFVCRVFKYRYTKYSRQGEGEKRVDRLQIFIFHKLPTLGNPQPQGPIKFWSLLTLNF